MRRQADWRNDSTEAEWITEEQLRDSLFELTDLWCHSVTVNEYVAFLDTIVSKLDSVETSN